MVQLKWQQVNLDVLIFYSSLIFSSCGLWVWGTWCSQPQKWQIPSQRAEGLRKTAPAIRIDKSESLLAWIFTLFQPFCGFGVIHFRWDFQISIYFKFLYEGRVGYLYRGRGSKERCPHFQRRSLQNLVSHLCSGISHILDGPMSLSVTTFTLLSS